MRYMDERRLILVSSKVGIYAAGGLLGVVVLCPFHLCLSRKTGDAAPSARLPIVRALFGQDPRREIYIQKLGQSLNVGLIHPT
jgi:hypothetical protein